MNVDEQDNFILNIIGNLLQVVEKEAMSLDYTNDNSDHLLAITACSRELVDQYMKIKYGIEIELED